MSESHFPPRRQRATLALIFLLPGLVAVVLTGCAGQRPAPADPSQPMTAYILPPDAGGPTGPRLRVTVPRRDLVFLRDGGAINGGLEVTVVAWSGDRQVGGGVAKASLEVPDWQAAGSDSLFALELPVVLETAGAVNLEVRARSLGSSRCWVRRIPCPPSAWRPLPFVLADWDWNADPDGVLDGADSLRVDLTLVRQPAVSWPPEGCGVGVRLKSAWAGETRVLRPLPPLEAQADTVRLQLAVSAGDLPLGAYGMELGLGDPAPGGAELQIRVRRQLRSLVLDLYGQEAWLEHLHWLDHRLNEAQMERLRHLPVGARWEALDELWLGPADRREHLLRIVEADTRFAFQGRGALTDRGRVFIRRGPPDRIERKGSPGDRFQRWEFWYYDGPGELLVFLDSHGLGEYRLIENRGWSSRDRSESPD